MKNKYYEELFFRLIFYFAFFGLFLLLILSNVEKYNSVFDACLKEGLTEFYCESIAWNSL